MSPETDVLGRLLERLDEELRPVVEALQAVVQAHEEQRQGLAQQSKGDETTLRGVLLELEPHLGKRKPKPAKELVQRLVALQWSGANADTVSELAKLVSKYKFNEASAVVEKALQRLGREASHDG